MLSKDKMPEGVNVSLYRVLVTALNQSSWIIGSVLGGLLGSLLEFDSTGIDFAMTALFTTVFIKQWLSSKCHIPSMVVIIIVLTLLRKKIEPEGELNYERL